LHLKMLFGRKFFTNLIVNRHYCAVAGAL